MSPPTVAAVSNPAGCSAAGTRSGGPVSVLVLGGGPDAEREVSLNSARHVADALEAGGGGGGRDRVHRQTIDTLTITQLRALPGEVVFPVLHGGWGEGGQLQELLEADGRPFVGAGSRSSRLAMDKIGTKAAALRLGIPTPPMCILDPRDPGCPLDLPVVIKPVHEGSTIGLFVCETLAQWRSAREAIGAKWAQRPEKMLAYMVEPKIAGRELTVGLLDGEPLPIIEIVPAAGLYDYEAKYLRDDTQYRLDPDIPEAAADAVRRDAVALAHALGVRHLARADFILDAAGVAWMLEINTLPGFTDHSLVPMAARHAGLTMPELCGRLVEMAVRDHAAVGARA